MAEVNTEGRYKRHLLSYVDEAGNRRALDVPRPSYELGNAKHWIEGLTERWQLRRIEISDLPPGVELTPGGRLLGRSLPGVGGIYYFAYLPPLNRENTPSNVALALRRAARANPKFRRFVVEMEKLSRTAKANGSA